MIRNTMKKAVFLDRDGVLNKELGDYVCKFEDFKVLEHNFPALIELQSRGYLLIVITNQGGLAKGWYSEDTLGLMHDHLRKTYADQGIHVNGIAPGAIETPMNAADFAGEGLMAKQVAEETPLKRWAQPKEVADLTLFLASKQANYMQGTIIPIDGGWTLK